MRTLFIFLIFFSSIPVYADCNCAGDVYLHIVYEDKSGVSHDVRAFGGDWSDSQTKTSTQIEKLSSQLENGAHLQIVNAFKTHPIKIPNNGTVRIPFVVFSGKEINKSSVKNIKSVEVISAGCNAYPSPVRQVNQRILTGTKPAKVEEENNKQFGGATYRVFFNKQGKLIWLRYFPEKTGRCLPLSKAVDAISIKEIFSVSDWRSSASFLNWATPLKMTTYRNKQCSDDIFKKIEDSKLRPVLCQQIATIFKKDGKELGKLFYAIRSNSIPGSNYDCENGVIYLGNNERAAESSPVSCEAILNVVDPADKPVEFFQINKTGKVGMVLSNHGLECSNRWVVLQQENTLKREYLLESSCMH